MIKSFPGAGRLFGPFGATLAGAISVLLVGVLASFLIAPPHAATAQSVDDIRDPTTTLAIRRGGQLYDKWWAVIEAEPPATTHPAYTAEGQKSGSTTWRCKECHGWDYKGLDGAYSRGSHFSGIIGVRSVVDIDPGRIAQIIRDETHGYTEQMLPRSAVDKLALFLSQGQVDMDVYIDRATKKARGNTRRGAAFFQTICAVCHGFDGKDLNVHDADDPEYVGTVAAGNPWEALHKIRFGQPGVGMVSLGALDIQDQVDILAYTQTLPTE